MLTVGDKFPCFDLKAVIDTKIANAFTQITEQTHKGKWLVVFAWPKDFTFVCPTEIAAFGKMCGEFKERGITEKDIKSAVKWARSKE